MKATMTCLLVFTWRWSQMVSWQKIQWRARSNSSIGLMVIWTHYGQLAYIRTWTYITNRSDWTNTPVEWQDRTRIIEDKLSDRLHQRLSERFVDKRVAHLSRKLKETKNLIASVKDDGTVLVEGEEVGHLTGFVFNPTLADSEEKATILAAARRSSR